MFSTLSLTKSESGLISTLLEGGFIIFCGAGISVNSGIPLSKDLISEILEQVSPKITTKRFREVVGRLPLEVILDTLKKNSDISEIMKVFVNSHPNRNHQMIAELAKRRMVKTIVTTNFDTLIAQYQNMRIRFIKN